MFVSKLMDFYRRSYTFQHRILKYKANLQSVSCTVKVAAVYKQKM